MQLRQGEIGLSCTRLLLTSPWELLEQLRLQDKSPDDWMVCRISVADVRALGLDVVHVPTDDDYGHCEVRGNRSVQISKGIASKLAKKTRILTDDEIATVKAGGILD